LLKPKLDGARILITGSSGWLGSETLCYLLRTLGSLSLGNIVCLSTDGRTFNVHENRIQSRTFLELHDTEGFDLIIHLAFLLPNNLIVADAARYIELNSTITRRMEMIFKKNPKALKVVLSSGAVNLDSEMSETEGKLLYARSKREMESVLQDDQSIILRLWSTTGHHIPVNSSYAISDFINRAILNENILIKRNVKRSYIDFQDILGMTLGYILDSGRGIYNSGGQVTTVEDLARLVISALNSNSEIIVENRAAVDDLNYISPECEIPTKYIVSPMSLESQVKNTLTSLIYPTKSLN
jgi:nucleoside-diphosphate-sugar epimerase